ncbi:MAG: DUF192 domain-containing protein [Myxococcota bacterium]|nr:DUF192 domain-containing protein [Myxococcota bacterium]
MSSEQMARTTAFLVLLSLHSLWSCTTPQSRTGPSVRDAGHSQQKMIDVEVVDDRFEISRGLMCRTEMQGDWGMLFFMAQTRIQSFWMKNTLLALDMIFIDDNWQVVGVVTNAQPETLTSRSVSSPSRYVLELKAGQAAAYGLKAGSQLNFIPPQNLANSENGACQTDRDCTGTWSPNDSMCGPIERCFLGECIIPPAVSGEMNAQTGRLQVRQ